MIRLGFGGIGRAIRQVWRRACEGRRDQSMDGKGKGRPSARLMWLVGLANSPTSASPLDGASLHFPNEINGPSAFTVTEHADFCR
jgi:hypothetical protein